MIKFHKWIPFEYCFSLLQLLLLINTKSKERKISKLIKVMEHKIFLIIKHLIDTHYKVSKIILIFWNALIATDNEDENLYPTTLVTAAMLHCFSTLTNYNNVSVIASNSIAIKANHFSNTSIFPRFQDQNLEQDLKRCVLKHAWGNLAIGK